jgi:hypothetical protein
LKSDTRSAWPVSMNDSSVGREPLHGW